MDVYYRKKDNALGIFEVNTDDPKVAIDVVKQELKNMKEKYTGAVLALVK